MNAPSPAIDLVIVGGGLVGASLALSLEATPWEIGAATHAHPTYSEILAEAAMAVDGRSINF